MSAVEQIEAAQARNLAVERSHLASMPEVGIFWLIENKLVADSIPWRQADVCGGFYSGKNNHAAFWTTLQRLLPQWQGKEYTDFPRGRVLFDSMEEVFLVYSSRLLINSPEVRKMILAEFNLPWAATKFAADYHYENVIPPMLDENFDGSHASNRCEPLTAGAPIPSGTPPGEAGDHRPAPCPGGPALRLEQNFSGIKLVP